MARQIWDCVVETSTSTGSGDFTLAGAVTGYQRFGDTHNVGDRCWYLIEAIDGNGDRTGQWEVGDGTYSAADTLTRTRIIDSSTGAAVTFSAGTKRVSLIYPSTAADFQGALVTKGTNQTAANYTTIATVSWDTEDYDTREFHDNAVNNTRLTVPDGVTKVRLMGHVRISSLTASSYVAVYLYKNGSASAFTGNPGQMTQTGQTVCEVGFTSPVLNVVAGDYFELALEIGSDTSVTVEAFRSWFSIEVIV